MCETQVCTLTGLSPGTPTVLQAGGLPKASPPSGVRAAEAKEGKAGCLPHKSDHPDHISQGILPLPAHPSSHNDGARQSGLLAHSDTSSPPWLLLSLSDPHHQ